MDIIKLLLAVFFTIFATLCIWHKLLNRKIDYNNPKFYITLTCLMLIALINYFNVNAYIRITIVTLTLMIFFRFLFKENLQRCIITPIISQMIVMISEMTFAILISLLFKMNNEQIVNTQFGNLLSNLVIAIISVLLIKIPVFSKLYDFLIKITDRINRNKLIIFSLFIIVIANLLTMFLYYRVEFIYLLIFNTCLTLFCLSIVIYSFKTQDNYIKVYDKYNTTLNSLKEYEDILDRYRISNHENKNQLLIIRNMLPKTNKKLISYIDKIIENKLKDNEKAIIEACKIPAGGLRGLIYSKILVMKNLKINYILEISKSVKTVDLINLDDSLMLDICKVIGVYIDNAIEEVKKLGCNVVDITESNNNSNVLAYYITDSNTCPYLISYTKFKDSKLQNNFYNQLVKEAENINGYKSYSSVNFNNYKEYNSTNQNEYRAALYSGKITIYMQGDITSKALLTNLKKELGFDLKMDWSFLSYIVAYIIIVNVMIIISWWLINRKMGRQGWICLIPIYNIICLCEDVLGKKSYAWLFLIPYVNFVFIVILLVHIAKVFGKDDGYQILTVFFSSITIPLIAFDDSTYTRPNKDSNLMSNNTSNTNYIITDDNNIETKPNTITTIIEIVTIVNVFAPV